MHMLTILKIVPTRSCRGFYQIRSLYGKTGDWPKFYDEPTRKEVEDYWKPKLKELDAKYYENKNLHNKEKFYALSMFPYPSGNLHMGHVRVYTISDAIARYQRAKGKHVIHPMGWDAFGLPAENAAIDRGKQPDEWTRANIKQMKQQMDDLCYSFEYDRGFSTCDPEYYKWTQWIFLKMWEEGLVYQKYGLVNWDPVDKTVLADEQIDEHGCSWRSGAKVERKFLKQWYIKTSRYAESLQAGLEEVNDDLWDDVIQLQRHWIGEINGARFEMQLRYKDDTTLNEHFSLFTHHPEGLYGASHILVSPDHFLSQPQFHEPFEDDPLKTSWMSPKTIFNAIPSVNKKRNEERNIIPLKVMAQHPMKGIYLPIFLHKTWDFGDHLDCHIGMPCMNTQDSEFATEYDLRYTKVTDQYGLIANSGKFSGCSSVETAEGVLDLAKQLNRGGYRTSARSRDWCISRQRYWGTPIPMLHCKTSGAIPVPQEHLPVTLPEVSSFRGVDGKSPLALASSDWLNVSCPKSEHCHCGKFGDGDIHCCGGAIRETDTMDTFVDSAWYFLRYLSPTFNQGPFDPNMAKKHMPVDLYIGGKEHAIMHLYYARFFCHFFHDMRWLPEREPFKNLLTQGMVKGQSFREPVSGKYIARDQVDFSGDYPRDKEGNELHCQWEKMSKSKYNGVDPQHVLDEYGIDTTRLCILGGVAPKSERNWSDDLFHGILMWQYKLWKLVMRYREVMAEEKKQVDQEIVNKYVVDVFDARNYFLKEVNFHMEETFLISTAISRLQGYTTDLKNIKREFIPHVTGYERALTELVTMVSVFAPLFGAELREALGKSPDMVGEWPVMDPEYRVTMKVTVNKRPVFDVKLDLSLEQIDTLTRHDALELAMACEEWQKVLKGHDYDYASLRIVPNQSVYLHIVSVSLKKSKKATKKQQQRNNTTVETEKELDENGK